MILTYFVIRNGWEEESISLFMKRVFENEKFVDHVSDFLVKGKRKIF